MSFIKRLKTKLLALLITLGVIGCFFLLPLIVSLFIFIGVGALVYIFVLSVLHETDEDENT